MYYPDDVNDEIEELTKNLNAQQMLIEGRKQHTIKEFNKVKRAKAVSETNQ
jgi:hypothetical protein